ncbi:eukaryotic translation initiation factor 4 gamma 1 isoform X7 [Gallus gallus]|uniref:Eukaryotic translation initiation factor 4 gamma 1 n=4 Tax=Gallus gallus TaxID=9031 RepID=A0A8V0Z8Y0_CHICK|nr:eukaryotic translation initiation factor 4 gamma 1 isoform X7 [Gallus gallus]XP_015147020.2 eukaryotic translation initiation factor 4 gamma 1 isoform X7 [Gallus gallus]XP_015147021.2 eukaryotic translation initiation factor 4 gamma 1 isoform X7 [Gallus gallus]XP_015147022.2 eukaryotic translation initiation factor 4 gamma 1 isoform X7 [Gallus gallus]XP_025009432.2 eukaryotic translation initiation factor 4 gamma 1 isoform X7 [Gallus gallus]XP_040561630.1 eukaryotic translation initiation f
MNKAPQPTGGAPTAPHPAPSPGLPQSAFPPGQTAPVIFNPTPTSQMNTPSQPRQFPAGPRAIHQQGGFRSLQHFYQNRAQPPASASRVQSNTTARPGPPAHVYPAASQVMMIPSQISYTPSQGAYYIPGQGRSTYVVPTQQYPVQPGAPSFYPGASPTEFGTYAGAYYPAQGVQQFPAGVPTAQVIVSQQPPIPPKRERKTIRIRDPNQGGKDITEEIMSGARTSSTPTPPQAGSGLEPQANGETPHVAVIVRPDDRPKPALVVSKPVSLEPSKSASPSPPPPLIPEVEPVVMSTMTLVPMEPPMEADTKVELGEAPPDLHQTFSAITTVPGAGELPLVPPPDMDTAAVVEEEVAEEVEEVAIPLLEPTLQAPALPEVPSVPAAPLMPAVPPVPAAPSPPLVVPPVPEAPAKPASPSPPPPQEEPCPEPVAQPAAEANGVLEEVPQPLPEAPVCQPVPVPISEPAPVPTPAPTLDSPIAQPEELPLPNGMEGSSKVEASEEQPESDISPISEPEEPVQPGTPASPPAEEEEEESEGPAEAQERSSSLAPAPSQTLEATVQVAVSVPKKKRRMKELNKKEAVGDLLDAFKESQISDSASEVENKPPPSAPARETEDAAPTRPQEESEETWEEKEDKLAPEKGKAGDQKYRYKEEQWKPLNPEEKKRYDREFLLGFQFIFASMQKPEGLPQITDVVLDKPCVPSQANKTPLRALDPIRLSGMNCSPDFTPSFANLGRPVMGNRGLPSGLGPRRSQQTQRKEPRKIIATVSLNEDVKLNKAEKAWKPSSKRASEEEDPENIKTQELLRRVRSILNKLTPQMFQQLMKQVMELSIDTEERLKGVIDLVFEKAISEPNFSVAYANMCRCLMGLKVPTTDKPTVTVNFRKLLLNRCQKEFEKDKDDDEIFEKRQKEMDDASAPEEKARMKDELEEARDKARRRSLGNIKFIGELFKLKMLTEAIMHDCVVKLLKNHDEESLECLCRLLTTIGKDLDFEKAKPRMDQYFNQMEKIIKEKKTSSRIRFMLQDVIDLRRNSWVPRRGDQGPKTIDQIHKEAEMEEHREHIKVQQLMSKDKRRGPPGPSISGGRSSLVADDGWNTVPISKGNRPIDTSRLTKITKPGLIDSNNQLFAPGGRLSWGKGSSGGSGAKPADSASDSGRPATSTLNRFSALQQSTPAESSESRRVVQRSSSSRDRSEKAGDRGDRESRSEKSSDRLERPDRGERGERNRSAVTKRSFSKETEDRSREREKQSGPEAVRKTASMSEERDRSRETIKQEPAPPAASPKPMLSEEELEKKSKAIIEEYLHINDMKEALQCVQELGSPSLLYVFVRNGIESTLERSTISREHMGVLLCHLVKAGTLSKEQYYKGLREILEIAEDMEIDIPHIWLYLAELITPILQEEGIPMEELFREITKPLVPLGKATTLLVEVLGLLCKGMSQKTAGKLWRDGGLSWKEFLPEDQDINKFVTEQKLEYTMGDNSDTPSCKELTSEELCKQMDKLLKENSNNQRIYDWIEANLSEQQVSSNTFIRALMTSVCHSAITFENPYRVDALVISNRAKLLQKYMRDEQKELQALYALQALVVKLDQPPNLLRMFFDALYDEDVIKEEAFYKWESSKDPAEQQGKGVALKSVTAFFTWLREAEDESDNN